jgi:hypothetical protein
MGAIIGPSKSHSSYANYLSNIALGATLCGGRLFCKSLGIAWIVAPAATQVIATWNGSTSGVVGDKPLVSSWSSLCTALTNGGLTPSDWFVPSYTQLLSGYACRTYWDTYDASQVYWSSTESSSTKAWDVDFAVGGLGCHNKTYAFRQRAFRCVTY